MSHFAVIVVGNNVDDALAPFEESPSKSSPFLVFCDESDEVRDGWAKLDGDERSASYDDDIARYAREYHGYDVRGVGDAVVFGRMHNPNARWDWWQIGGRYSNRYLPTAKGCVNVATVADLQWDGARSTAESEARMSFARWQKALDACKDSPLPIGWPAMREKHGEDIDGARAAYAAQPAIAIWTAAERAIDSWSAMDTQPVDEYGFDVEAFVARKRRGACVPFAYLHEGKWCARADMHWFAITSNDVDRDAWCTQWEAMIASLPGDTRLTVVDCHI